MSNEKKQPPESGSVPSKPFVISRLFRAPKDLLFRVWTDPEHLKHWWGPKDVRVTVKKLEMKPGGIYHYSMILPDGSSSWGKMIYREIIENEKLVFLNMFSDEDGNITRHPLAATWPLQMLSTITFKEQDEGTLVTIEWQPYEAGETEQATFDDSHESMNQGWSGSFEVLERYLAGLQAS